MADRYSDATSELTQAVVTMHEVIASHQQQEINANPGDEHFEEDGIDDEECQDDGDTDQEEEEDDEEEDYGGEDPDDENGEFSGESYAEGEEGECIYPEDPQWQKNQTVQNANS